MNRIEGGLLFPKSRNCHGVNHRECLIGIKGDHLKKKSCLKVFYLTKVEEAKWWTPEEVLITTFCGIGLNLMSRSASPAGTDEEFVLDLEPFIGMAVPTEK